MYQKLFTFVFLCCSIAVFSQKKYQKTYYNSGQLKEEGWVKNNQKNGYWTFYYKDGVKNKEGHYKNNKPIKYWYFYRQNSTKEKEGRYKNGKKNSWWLFYSKKGIMNHKCQLKKGQKDGFCFKYYQGKLNKAVKYLKGKKIKEWTDLKSFRKENNMSDLY